MLPKRMMVLFFMPSLAFRTLDHVNFAQMKTPCKRGTGNSGLWGIVEPEFLQKCAPWDGYRANLPKYWEMRLSSVCSVALRHVVGGDGLDSGKEKLARHNLLREQAILNCFLLSCVISMERMALTRPQ